MNKEQLEIGNNIMHSLEIIKDLRVVMHAPFPQFIGANDKIVNSAGFDDETLKGLKETVINYLSTRQAELEKELEDL